MHTFVIFNSHCAAQSPLQHIFSQPVPPPPLISTFVWFTVHIEVHVPVHIKLRSGLEASHRQYVVWLSVHSDRQCDFLKSHQGFDGRKMSSQEIIFRLTVEPNLACLYIRHECANPLQPVVETRGRKTIVATGEPHPELKFLDTAPRHSVWIDPQAHVKIESETANCIFKEVVQRFLINGP